MRISNFTTIRPEMASNRTYEDFFKFLGAKAHRLGVISSLYPQYSASHLTESLMNIYSTEKDNKKAMQSVDAFMIEWDLDIKTIKRVSFINVPEGDGTNGTDIIFHFPENYYQKNDTFIIENSRQQIIVTSRPIRRSDKLFEVIGKINDSSFDSVLDISACQPGMDTRFITNYQPEMHMEGYTKYQSNLERHRTFIATHRSDVNYSAKYAAMEDVFIQIGKGDKDDPVYKLNSAKKDCLDTFMMARNNSLLWGKCNVDKHGKPKIFDNETGQPIISSDGIIAQIERFASKFVISDINVKWFNKILSAMVSKSEQATGNKYMFIVNTLLWQNIQDKLASWIRDHKTTGTFLFSKASNGYVDLGATYQSYEFGGKV